MVNLTESVIFDLEISLMAKAMLLEFLYSNEILEDKLLYLMIKTQYLPDDEKNLVLELMELN
jgi:hypothetical protein